MNLLTIICCALAGLAGWWGMALCEEGAKTVATPANTPVAAAEPVEAPSAVKDTVQKLRQARPGSAEISRIAALLSAIPNDSLDDLQNELYALPPSTARQFALTLLSQLLALAKDPSADPSAPPPADAEPPVNAFRELEEEMAEGSITPDYGSGGPGLNSQALRDWVSADPAIATAAILKMPAGTSRQSAVDIAAEVMSLTDSAGALEFVLQSGEPRPGWGTVQAWAKLITGPAPAGGPATSPAEFLHRMTWEQQDSLFSRLAYAAGSFDDSNLNPNTPSGGSDLSAIARAVLQATASGPGLESFFQDLTDHHPRTAEEVLLHIHSSTQLGAVHAMALEILVAARVQRFVDSGGEALQALGIAAWDNPRLINRLDDDPVTNRVASSLAGSLANSGRLSEALQLLDSLTDPDTRHASTLSLLPAWMDADPAAARAAFNATPMTALDRERWERHPAFLLHQTGEDR